MESDVVIVGGGIVGALVATRILEWHPSCSVTLVDRGAAGDGASRYSAGLHIPRGTTPTVREWARTSEQYYLDLLAADPDLPIRGLGMIVLSRDEDEAQVRETYLDRPRTTPAPGVVDASLATAAGMWSVHGAQHADVRALTRALVDRLRRRALILEATEVLGLQETTTDVVLELSTGLRVRTDQVVLAPGPWIGRPLIGAAAPGARVKKVVALHVDSPPTPDDPVVLLHDEDAFLLPVPGRGQWLFSYTSQEWDVDPDVVGDQLVSSDLTAGRRILARWSRSLAEQIHSGRVFCDAYSGSGEPVVRAKSPRVCFAGATNGAGYRLGPAIAARTAEIVTAARNRSERKTL